MQVAVFTLVFLVIAGLILRRMKKVKTRTIDLVSSSSEGKMKSASRADLESNEKTVYLPMAGDQRSAHKAQKAQKKAQK